MSRAFALAFAAWFYASTASAAGGARLEIPASSRYYSAPFLAAPGSLYPLAVMPMRISLAAALSPAAPAPLTAAPDAVLPPALAFAAAAAPAPTPAMAPALSAVSEFARAAALDAPGAPGAPGDEKPAAPKSIEEDAASAGKTFDGSDASGATPAAPAPVAAAEAPVPAEMPAPSAKPKRAAFPLGAGLKAADPADEPWLADLVGALSTSKTGRRILRDIAELEQKRGNPTMVVIKAIGNNGEFRYDSDLLVMDSTHRRRAPELTAPIFAHELQHVLQRGMNLPVDALELEVESYTVETRVWTELGIEPEAGSFARDARNRLRRDPDLFFVWLAEQYKNNSLLHGRRVASYIKELEDKKPANLKRIARAEKDLEAARLVAASMRAQGKSADAIRSFEEDDVEPVERRLRAARVETAWIERDLALLSTPEGRKRFRDYSRGVIRRARAISRP